MANRYWVPGGTGNWNSTTNWSTASGGASGASVPGTADIALLNASSGSGTVTLDISPSVLSMNNTGFLGTLAFGTNTISLVGTGTQYTGSTTMTVTGTPLIILTDSSATARTISPGAVTEANSISFRITGGTGTMSITTGAVRDLDFTDGVNSTGYAGALQNAIPTIYGNFKASTGMTKVAGTGTFTFAATSGTKTINTAGVTFDNPFVFNGVGGTWQLQGALTSGSTRACTLTNGTLDLNNYTLTSGTFSASGGTSKALAFGTGNITVTGTGTVYTGSTLMTVTGTPLVICTDSSATGRTLSPSATTEAYAISFNVTAGTGNLTLTSNGAFKDINLTGFAGTLATSNPDIYGNFTIPAGVTIASTGTFNFKATSGIKTITTNGVSFDRPFIFNGVGGSWQLQGALTLFSTRQCTLTAGSLLLNGYTLTTGSFSSSNTNARTLTFGNGSIVLTDSPWATSDVTNLTTDATGTISMSSASAKLFNGGGRTWSKLINSGAGTLTITGANTFMELGNSVTPAFFVFPASTTTSAYAYSINGTASNLVSLRSSSPGTQYTLAKL